MKTENKWNPEIMESKINLKSWINGSLAHSAVISGVASGSTSKALGWPSKSLHSNEPHWNSERSLFTSPPHQIRQLSWPQMSKAELEKLPKYRWISSVWYNTGFTVCCTDCLGTSLTKKQTVTYLSNPYLFLLLSKPPWWSTACFQTSTNRHLGAVGRHATPLQSMPLFFFQHQCRPLTGCRLTHSTTQN